MLSRFTISFVTYYLGFLPLHLQVFHEENFPCCSIFPLIPSKVGHSQEFQKTKPNNHPLPCFSNTVITELTPFSHFRLLYFYHNSIFFHIYQAKYKYIKYTFTSKNKQSPCVIYTFACIISTANCSVQCHNRSNSTVYLFR